MGIRYIAIAVPHIHVQQFQYELPGAAFVVKEFAEQFVEQLRGGGGDRVEAGGWAVEEQLDAGRVDGADRVDGFDGSAEHLIDAQQQVVAEARRQVPAGQVEHVADALDADLAQGFDCIIFDAQGLGWQRAEERLRI